MYKNLTMYVVRSFCVSLVRGRGASPNGRVDGNRVILLEGLWREAINVIVIVRKVTEHSENHPVGCIRR